MNAKHAKRILEAQGWVLGHKHRACSDRPVALFNAYSKELGHDGRPRYRLQAETLAALCLKVTGKHWRKQG